jgi:hypothetical protein
LKKRPSFEFSYSQEIPRKSTFIKSVLKLKFKKKALLWPPKVHSISLELIWKKNLRSSREKLPWLEQSIVGITGKRSWNAIWSRGWRFSDLFGKKIGDSAVLVFATKWLENNRITNLGPEKHSYWDFLGTCFFRTQFKSVVSGKVWAVKLGFVTGPLIFVPLELSPALTFFHAERLMCLKFFLGSCGVFLCCTRDNGSRTVDPNSSKQT